MSELTTKLFDMILEVNPDCSYLSDVKVHHLPTAAKPFGINGVAIALPFLPKRMFIISDYDLTNLTYLMSHELDHLKYINENGFGGAIYAAYFPHKRLEVERSATVRGLSTLKKLSRKYPKVNYDKFIKRIKSFKYSRNPIKLILHLIYYRNLRLE